MQLALRTFDQSITGIWRKLVALRRPGNQGRLVVLFGWLSAARPHRQGGGNRAVRHPVIFGFRAVLDSNTGV